MKMMLDCDTAMRQLWDYLDGELSEERMTAMREHLAMCAHCHPKEEFARSFLDSVALARREHPDTNALSAQVREALRRQGLHLP